MVLVAGSVYAAEKAGMPVNPTPVIKEVKGANDIFLAAAVYPQIKVTPVPSEAGLGCQAKVDEIAGDPVSASVGKFEKVDGLKTVVKIDPAYRASAKVLVSWTVRVEGECPTYRIWPTFCPVFHGDVQSKCPSGVVETRLYVNGKVKSPPFSLEMPESTGEIVNQPNDPTITGTYLLKAEDFDDNKLPEKIELQVWWKNYSSMKMTSPANMRTLTVNIMPTTRSDK